MPSLEPKARLPFEGGLIAGVALLCLGFQLRLPSQLPQDADYQQVEAVLQAEAKPGDALLLYPWWTEKARLYAPRGLTVVGYQGSDADDLELHPRVWVLSQPDLPKASWSDFSAAFSKLRSPNGAERVFGRLHLQLFDNGRYRAPTFALAEVLANAQAYLEQPDGSRQACSFDGRGHRCPNNGYVAAEWHEVRFQPRQCVRLYPPGGPTKLVVELGQGRAAQRLRLQAGYTWDRGYFKDPSHLGVTHVQAEVDGQKVASLELPQGRFGLVKDEGGPLREGQTVRVWSQADNAHDRDLCVELFGFAKEAP